MSTPSPIDLSTGSWTSGHPTKATIAIAGDWAPIREFQPLIEKDPESIYGDLLPIIRNADLSVVNLEAPLSDTGKEVCKSGAVFKGDACHVNGLAAVPFDGVTLGNNHMFDFGVEAFQETIAALDKHNIGYTGAGMNLEEAKQPLFLETKGIRLAIVNISEGEDLTAAGQNPGVMGWDIPAVEAMIQKLKSEETGKKVDAVIAVAHCGLEYIPFPPEYVTDAFRALAEAGADAVIGHHPHVPQGLFFHNKTPICCSLGNFIFYQPTRLFWRKLGYMVNLGFSDKGLTALDIIPYQIHDQGVSALKGSEKDYFFKRFEEISTPLSTREGCRSAWNGFIDYYGIKGFKNEVKMILDKLETEQGKGAAMFRNRLTTAQHFYHWKDLLTRIVNNQMGDAPKWAGNLAKEWLTREVA